MLLKIYVRLGLPITYLSNSAGFKSMYSFEDVSTIVQLYNIYSCETQFHLRKGIFKSQSLEKESNALIHNASVQQT